MNTTARQIALLSLCRCEKDGKYSNLENDAAIKKFNLQGSERKLYTKLLYGTVEKRITLDYIISQISNKKIEDMSVQMLNILRMSIYQLRYLDRIPAHAAVDEGVQLAKKYVSNSSSSFVNAVLREYLRRKGNFSFPKDDFEMYLSVRYSVNKGVVRALYSSCGEECEKMLQYLDESAQFITLRVNTLNSNTSDVIGKLQAHDIPCVPTSESPFGVRILSNIDIPTLENIIGNTAFIEDEASQIAICALGVSSGMTVVDVCAAPGGKSISAAMAMNNEGIIYSYDLHESKISLISKTAEKMGVTIVKSSVRNGKLPVEDAMLGIADRVICDVPCSGLGVIGKKPDLRYKDMDNISSLLDTQLQILYSSAAYLKKGGRLLYSTCTLNEEENGKNVEKFLKENTGYRLLCQRTLMPHLNGTDGFYIAVIEKI